MTFYQYLFAITIIEITLNYVRSKVCSYKILIFSSIHLRPILDVFIQLLSIAYFDHWLEP